VGLDGRVAMLRLDVLYVTPIDIYKLPDNSLDKENKFAVVPAFASQPVNDRMIYGPYDAVRLWAAGRFSRLEHHAKLVHRTGDGIHSERFLYRTIFPAIRDFGVEIVKDKVICFLRVRADASVRFSDCSDASANEKNQKAVELLTRRRCSLYIANEPSFVKILECDKDGDENEMEKKGMTWEITGVS
jgi:hypothetical protein